MLLIFTDGIPDARNDANLEYGKGPVIRKMSACSHSAANLLEEIAAEVHAFIGAAEQFDDITLLAVKRHS
jgi:serine phosphatase RsbU (regulator of sigma subunit)